MTTRCGEACDDGGRWHARIDGLRPGDVVHLGLVASGAVDAVATDLAIVSGLAAADQGEDTDDGEVPAADGIDAVHAHGASATCACRSDATPRAAIAAVLVAWLGARRRRRRCG
ncbi:MAG: hypothetical protein U0168_11040 [Nannocystaceae bacterium]